MLIYVNHIKSLVQNLTKQPKFYTSVKKTTQNTQKFPYFYVLMSLIMPGNYQSKNIIYDVKYFPIPTYYLYL